MAIGTAAAIGLGVSALAGGAASVIGANKAAGAARDAADQSAAVQREQLQAAQTALAPYQQAGTPATQQINALLGIGDQTDWAGWISNDPAAMRDYYQNWSGAPGSMGSMSLADYGKFQYTNDLAYKRGEKVGNDGQYYAGADPNYKGYDISGYTGAGSANRAFDQFRNSTGYNFRVKEGMNALNSGYAGAGTIKSGAAMKAAVDYGQNMASQEFGNYLNALGNQQGVGMSSASALAGVGQNFANSMSAINTNRADAVGNAALANAGNINSMLGTAGYGILKYGVK